MSIRTLLQPALPAAAMILGLCCSVASAQDCTNPADQATLTQCAGQDLAKADAALNDTYKQLMGRLKTAEPTRTKLIAAQRAWIGFRDADCAFRGAAAETGSIYPMIIANCRTALTNKRTKALQALLRCDEGDMSCPVPPP